jgi:3-isopropylmalate/(R)-2-methylmalate dehydratase small subunit
MQAFTALTATACPLPLPGRDTDQLIPARFMKRTRSEGYGDALLHDLRFDAEGTPRMDFPLNHPRRADAAILVARRNFGAGSSREAAVYALWDYGVRCVLAPSFGDIFAANAVNNGLLPARLEEADAERLLQLLQDGLGALTVDLRECRVQAGAEAVPFQVDPVFRTKLLNGWDDLDLTASYGAEIASFAARDAAARPWMPPRS